MSYMVMARKWRPASFEEVVAQDHVTKTLENALRSGRIAHAYLFSGPRGVGKTTTARILARAVNCVNGPTPTPCGACPICEHIGSGKSLDVIEIDGASHRGIDEIRELREAVRYAPSESKYKVYIIDEVHMLTTEAFNALLKTLEEPPEHVVFIFATTEPHKIPATILSRCQRFDFRRISTDHIVDRLSGIAEKEEIQVDRDALFLLARKADGALRDAESLLDQLASFEEARISPELVEEVLGLVDRDVLFGLTDAIVGHDAKGSLELVDRVIDEGRDPDEFVLSLMEHLRNLLFVKIEDDLAKIDLLESDRPRYEEASTAFTEEDLLRMIQMLSDLEADLGRSSQPRLRLELTMVKLAKLEPTVQLEALLKKLAALEERIAGRATPVSISPEPGEGTDPTASPGEARAPVSPERESGPKTSTKRPKENAASSTSGETPASPSARSDPQGTAKETHPPRSDPTAPASTSPDVGIEPTFENVRERWGAVVAQVKGTKISLGTFLSEGRPKEIVEDVLRIAFEEINSFHASQVMKNRGLVEEALAEVFSRRLRIQCVLENGGRTKGSNGGDAGDGLKMVLEVFDGELIDR